MVFFYTNSHFKIVKCRMSDIVAAAALKLGMLPSVLRHRGQRRGLVGGSSVLAGQTERGRHRRSSRCELCHAPALIGGYGSKPLSGEIFPRFGSGSALASVSFLFFGLRPMQILSAEEIVDKTVVAAKKNSPLQMHNLLK